MASVICLHDWLSQHQTSARNDGQGSGCNFARVMVLAGCNIVTMLNSDTLALQMQRVA